MSNTESGYVYYCIWYHPPSYPDRISRDFFLQHISASIILKHITRLTKGGWHPFHEILCSAKSNRLAQTKTHSRSHQSLKIVSNSTEQQSSNTYHARPVPSRIRTKQGATYIHTYIHHRPRIRNTYPKWPLLTNINSSKPYPLIQEIPYVISPKTYQGTGTG